MRSGAHGGDRQPKFGRVAAAIRDGVAEEVFPVGSRLPTEHELARAHGVSVNTVRRAIDVLVQEGLVRRKQGSGTYVEARARQPVLPNPLVGVMVPSASYYFPKVIQGIDRVLAEHGARMVLCTSEYDVEREYEHLDNLADSRVQGILVAPTLHLMEHPHEYMDRLSRLPVPYVLVERAPALATIDDDVEFVATDHRAGAFAAVRHLARLGHSRVGYLGRLGTATAAQARSGYDAAVDELGLGHDADLVEQRGTWTTEEVRRYATSVTKRGATAVLCLGDREATALLHAARALDRRVPEDLALVAYDDEVADLPDVPLTAVAPPKEELGRTAAEVLMRRVHEGAAAPTHQVHLKPRLVIRASCGAAAHLSPAATA